MISFEKRHLKSLKRLGGSLIEFKGKTFIDLSNNDYLGIACSPYILKKTLQESQSLTHFGACSSRLLSGNYELYDQLEKNLACWTQQESALVFPSGYQLNISILQALLSPKDIIFCDKYIHASMIDGIKLSGVPFKRFQHNDMQHLETLLNKYRTKHNQAWIMAEGLYSMDGDLCPLQELIALKRKYQCSLFLDEAHSFGIFGEGKGLAAENKLSKEIDYITLTFGKSLGAQGACIASSHKVCDQIVQNCRGLIYSTGLPTFTLLFILNALDYIEKKTHLGPDLLKQSFYLRNKLKTLNIKTLGSSQIIAILKDNKEEITQLCHYLLEKGFFVLPIFHPTVPKDKPRIRISLNSNITNDSVNSFIDALRAYT